MPALQKVVVILFCIRIAVLHCCKYEACEDLSTAANGSAMLQVRSSKHASHSVMDDAASLSRADEAWIPCEQCFVPYGQNSCIQGSDSSMICNGCTMRPSSQHCPDDNCVGHICMAQVQLPTLAKAITTESPSVFVAIMTAPSTEVTQRNAVRRAWDAADGGTNSICYRFVVCRLGGQSKAMWAEHEEHRDILFLDCEEGYERGLLTRKLITVMHVFSNATAKKDDKCLDRQLFMKTDDDTFVNPRIFHQKLTTAVLEHGADSIYAGGYQPAWPAIRDPSHPWYEPWETWPEDFPPSMLGGTGYILGRGLVQQILQKKIAEQHILYNEDRAVGVWISMLEKESVKVTWVDMAICVDLPDSVSPLRPYIENGRWGGYPYALHHHLSAKIIECLTELQARNDPEAEVWPCFVWEFRLNTRIDGLSVNPYELN